MERVNEQRSQQFRPWGHSDDFRWSSMGTDHRSAAHHAACDLLALGLLRLRSRIAERSAAAPADGRDCGDIRLPSTARQRRHANPPRTGHA